jgi:hypothetical protein
MHYDYYPNLGALPAMPAMPSAGAALFAPSIPQMQDGIARNLTAYQIYNLIRFDDFNIGGPKAGVAGFPALTRRMKLNTPWSGGYTIPFYGVREVFKKTIMPNKFKNRDLNSKLYKDFKAALGVVRLLPLPGGALPPSGAGADTNDNENIDEGANTQGTTPSAFPIVPVAIAAGLALLLLSRR